MRYEGRWPIPCLNTKENLDGQLVKIEEELAEFSIEHFGDQSCVRLANHGVGCQDFEKRKALIEEGVDIIAAVITYMAKRGVSSSELDAMVALVNFKNTARGYV